MMRGHSKRRINEFFFFFLQLISFCKISFGMFQKICTHKHIHKRKYIKKKKKQEIAKKNLLCVQTPLCMNHIVCIGCDFWFDFLIKNAGMKIHNDNNDNDNRKCDYDESHKIIKSSGHFCSFIMIIERSYLEHIEYQVAHNQCFNLYMYID